MVSHTTLKMDAILNQLEINSGTVFIFKLQVEI